MNGAGSRLPTGLPRAEDLALAVVFGVVALVEPHVPGVTYRPGPLAVETSVGVVVVVAIAVRRMAPVGALISASAAVALPTLVVAHAFQFWSHLLPLAVLVFAVARWRGSRTALIVLPVPVVAVGVVLVLQSRVHDPTSLFYPLTFICAGLAGAALRGVVQQQAQLGEAMRRLDSERSELERLSTLQERSRIAAGFQADVSRSVSALLQQAVRARALVSHPAAARVVLLGLERTGRGATAELRSILGLLQADGDLVRVLRTEPTNPEHDELLGRRVVDSLRRSPRPGRRAVVIDGAATLALLAVMWWEYRAGPADDGFRYGPVPVSVALSALGVAVIAVRRVWPVAALVVSTAAIALPMLVTVHWVLFWTGTLPNVFLLYTVARHRPGRTAAWCAALPLVALLAMLARVSQDALSDLLFLGTLELLALAAGITLRRHELDSHRLHALLTRLEHDQVDRRRVARLTERRRIACDLHDVVAHAVAVMLLQAGAARLALEDDPAAAEAFLCEVERLGRVAAVELEQLCWALDTAAAGVPEGSGGLDRVQVAIADMRAAGLDVELVVTGEVRTLPRSLSEAAQRIVVEALTNVAKHAGPTRVEVQIDVAGDLVRVAVEDDGPRGHPPTPAASGHGVPGMRERAARLGGELTAGPHGTGYRVSARLPVLR